MSCSLGASSSGQWEWEDGDGEEGRAPSFSWYVSTCARLFALAHHPNLHHIMTQAVLAMANKEQGFMVEIRDDQMDYEWQSCKKN